MHSILYSLLPFLILFSNLLLIFSFHPSLSSYDYFLCQYSFFTTPFSPFPSSVGSNCSISTVEVDGTYLDLEIWDTAGQERFAYMAPLYYRRAQAAIVVYDITDKVHTCIAIIDALINSVGSQTHFHMILVISAVLYLQTTCKANSPEGFHIMPGARHCVYNVK